MNPINKLAVACAAFALVSTAANAQIIYYQNFSGGTMYDSVTNTNVGTEKELNSAVVSNVIDSNGNSSANAGWSVHNGNSSGSTTVGGTNNMQVGHNGIYNNGYYNKREQSVYTFSVDATGFDNLSLMFNYDSLISSDDFDGASLVAYKGTFNATTIGNSGYTLLNPSSGFPYEPLSGGDGAQLAVAQFGAAADTVGFQAPQPGYGSNPNGGQDGTAMFDVSAAGFDNSIINFRLAFGSNSANQYSGINFDNFKLTGSDCTYVGGSCEPPDGGGGVPEPASITLAMLGLAAAYRSRKKKPVA
jgi:hypothetical protein